MGGRGNQRWKEGKLKDGSDGGRRELKDGSDGLE